ncbi:MAG: hypothetical protein LUD72_04020 [Bacteroidales bacterium]|nr:hypothetical protein [Bacteroidales bacterium]
MGLIKGVPIILYEKNQTGVDEFNNPVFEETPVIVENVLITPEGDTDIVSDTQLHGKEAEYELSIPKGDTHEWADRKVEFFGQMWETYGFSREYIESLTPLSWNRKVKVRRYG